MTNWKRIDESEIRNKDYAMRQVVEYVANARTMLGNAIDLLDEIGVPEDDPTRTRINSHYWDLDDTVSEI